MNRSLLQDGIAANIHALHDILAKAMVDATTACQNLENGRRRAAIGAVVPIGQALQDATSLVAVILLLNRELE